MTSADMDYYQRRVAQEREAACDAGKQHIADIHFELARAYEALLEHSEVRAGLRLVA